jgi:hypothetical protein
MTKTTSTRADRSQQLNRLHASKILELYNGAVGKPSGTVEDRGMPKEGMIRSILLQEGYEEQECGHDEEGRYPGFR